MSSQEPSTSASPRTTASPEDSEGRLSRASEAWDDASAGEILTTASSALESTDDGQHAGTGSSRTQNTTTRDSGDEGGLIKQNTNQSKASGTELRIRGSQRENTVDSEYAREYAAFFTPRSHAFDTVDRRTPASVFNRHRLLLQSARDVGRFARRNVVLAVLIGVCVGLVAFSSDQLTRGIIFAIYRSTNAAGLATSSDVASETSGPSAESPSASSFVAAVFTFISISVVPLLCASIAVVRIAPLGASSGIPQLKAYLNGVHVPGFLSLKTGVVKAIGIGMTTGGGLISGRQGAMGHVGAVIGAGLSQAVSGEFGYRWFSRSAKTWLGKQLAEHFRSLRTEEWKMNFTAVGASVGIATTFNAPMGGWMWIYEEASTHWDWSLGVISLAGCLTGVLVMGLMRVVAHQMNFETSLGFDMLGRHTADSPASYPMKDLPGYIALSAIGAFVGTVLPFVNKRITLLRYRFSTKPVTRVAEVAIIGIVGNLLRILIPYLANDCRPANDGISDTLAKIAEQDYSQFNCPPGQYSPWAALIYSPMQTVLRLCLHAPVGAEALPIAPLLVASCYYYFFIVISFGLAIPAGVFLPAFALGSVYGRLVGTIVETMFPGRGDVSVRGYALLGSVSALSGISRGISVSVIVLEATGSLDAAYPAVLVALLSKLMADALHRQSIYDVHISLKNMPFLAERVPSPETYHDLQVAAVMSTHIIAVRARARVKEIRQVLLETSHDAFPVFLRSDFNAESRDALSLSPYDPSIAPNSISRDVLSSSESSQDIASSSSAGRSRRAKSDLVGDTAKLRGLLGMGRRVRQDHPQATLYPASGPERSHANTRYSESIIVGEGERGQLQATIYENGVTTYARLQPRQRWLAVGDDSAESATLNGANTSESIDLSSGATHRIYESSNTQTTLPDFSLLGIIDRNTLLTLIEAVASGADTSHRRGRFHDRDTGSTKGMLTRDNFDVAWPNNSRRKRADAIYEKVSQAHVEDAVIDLRDYLNPDPVLISDTAMVSTAYMMFRRTGTRHILVMNMREGRIGGIMTRKDILPDSVNGAAQELESMKTV